MRRILVIFILSVVVLVAGGAGVTYLWLKSEYQKPSEVPVDAVVLIERGTGVSAIANQLQKDGLVSNADIFRFGLRLFGDTRPLRAGEYKIPAASSAADIARILKEAEQVTYRITVAEGLTSTEIVELIKYNPVLTGDIDGVPQEGMLLPETYHFHRGETRASLITRMKAAMSKALREAWSTRDQSAPLSSPEEMLTLASIVEKETGVDAERALVAGVFVNRLRKGMRLQSDPTVVYGITLGAGPLGRGLRRSELDARTPYNTYQINGLPPSPIANPGRASLKAVARPAETDALYFVADGTGGHAFSKTLDEHNRNVRAWRKIERARQQN